MNRQDREIEAAATILSKATRATAFCGAGISEESGIATFRDPGGLWDRVDPVEVGTSAGLVKALQQNSEKLVPLFLGILEAFEQAEANSGHFALADLEKMDIMRMVITQNVDNLQYESGSENVIEVHGNLFRMKCLSCESIRSFERKTFIKELRAKFETLASYSLDALLTLAAACERCGNIMRPDVVMFGEAVQDLTESFRIAGDSDVMLVLGTSGIVYPAAYFPVEAKKSGAKIIVVNPTENSFSQVSDIYIPAKTGEALPAIVKRIEAMIE